MYIVMAGRYRMVLCGVLKESVGAAIRRPCRSNDAGNV